MATVGRLFDFVGNLQHHDKSSLTTIFFVSDEDDSGEITWCEFLAFQVKARKALEATWPMDLKMLRNEFAAIDEDGSGSVSREEFENTFARLFGTR